MYLEDLATVPSFFKDRQDKIKKLVVFPQDVIITEFDYIIVLSCHRYTIKISFRSKFDPDSKIKLNCTCPSFNFEFAHILYKNDCLLEPEKYRKATAKIPKERNTKSVLGGCKHTIACARHILNNQEKIERLIEKKKLIQGV